MPVTTTSAALCATWWATGWKTVGVRRIKNLLSGDQLTIYVADDAAVYEIDGYQVICNYLAIEKAPKVQRGKSPESID